MQYTHHAGGRSLAGRNGGLAYHVDQLRAAGVAVETGYLGIGDALWIACSKYATVPLPGPCPGPRVYGGDPCVASLGLINAMQ